MGEPDPPTSYTLDVCLTCGRRAQWPFCAHRSEAERWTYALIVRPTDAERRRLLESMRAYAESR